MCLCSTVLFLNLKDVILLTWRLSLLHPISQTTVITLSNTECRINDSIPPRLELIEKKPSLIGCDKRSYEINSFADLIKENKSKMLAFPINDDRLNTLLVKSTNLLNAINDNNDIGLDNVSRPVLVPDTF